MVFTEEIVVRSSCYSIVLGLHGEGLRLTSHLYNTVLWIRIRIRRILMFLGLPDPEIDPDPDPSIIKIK
jgi:hypothetical protein